MDLDYAAFRGGESDSLRLELYYKVYNFGLGYEEKGGQWVAEYEVRVTVRDDDDYQVAQYIKERTLAVDSERKTRSLSDFRTSLADFILPSGKYKIVCELIDEDAGHQARTEFEVRLKSLDQDRPHVSDILFAQAVTSQADKASVFDRGNLVIIPSVSRGYGSATDDRLLYYIEIYPGLDETEDVVVETKLRSDGGSMVYRDTLTTVLDEPIKRQLRDISLADYRPGAYELEIRLLGRRLKELDKISQSFIVHWSGEALIVHDYDRAVAQLELIAEAHELDDLKEAETPERRKATFNQFWKDNDPSPGTLENEWKREFYRRVTFCDREFSIMRREGWRTDRGTIYIQRGAPDQVEDVPMSPNYPPYQIWYYYDGGPYREYTFVDANFDGEYRLVYPLDGLNRRPGY
jgi:GWxTD domain-containing protein